MVISKISDDYLRHVFSKYLKFTRLMILLKMMVFQLRKNINLVKLAIL